MPDYDHLKVDETDGIVTVEIFRHARKNALSRALMAELTGVAQAYRTASHVRAVILRGSDTFFSAGADITVFDERPGGSAELGHTRSLIELREWALSGPDMCKAWDEMEPVTIAAIEGACFGGAVALVLCCDFRIAGNDAVFRLPEVPLGINMSWRTLPRLTTLVGPSRAKRFTIFGEPTGAERLLEWGMVDELVSARKSADEAKQWAAKLAALPPMPVRMTKEAINAAANANHHASTFMDRDQFLLTFMSQDLDEGLAAFREKRSPKFTGN